jgi:hypothetical protein
MPRTRYLLPALLALLAAVFLIVPPPRPAHGYVEAGHSLGQVVNLSSNIVLMKVSSVDRKDNRIIYTKVRDLKGTHKHTEIRHTIGKAGFEPREWQTVMNWAEVGKEAIFFHNGSQSETCIGQYWYQAYGNANDPNNGYWGMSHAEPFLLRSFAGRVDKLAAAVTAMLEGKEVIVPCMVDGNKDDLKAARAKVQRLKASLKLNDYNPKRDFVGWGGEDFRRVLGMPGFTHISALSRIGPDAQGISCADFNADGKPDLCLFGPGRVALLQASAESLGEVSLPGATGARSAVWADYNGDGLPDLLLATPGGPRLYTNLDKGNFRDDTRLLPVEPGYNLTCAAWIDQDGDGRPDILLGNGFHGLRLYRNKGKATAEPPLALGPWHCVGPFPNKGNLGFLAIYGPEKKIDLKAKYKGKGGDVAWSEAKFIDGQINSLALFQDNTEGVVYLYREIRCDKDRELPVSLGSDDGLVVWLNGKRLISQNITRACAPDQAKTTLKLRKGANHLLLKVTQGRGDWGFYFKPAVDVPAGVTWSFEDVSDAVGLGEAGVGSADKGDTLTVCDLDADGKTDFIYGAGKGVVVRNDGTKFAEVKDSGISFETGQVGPVAADYDADGLPDLIVPQGSGVKLFRNEGKWKFADVTKKAGLGTPGSGLVTSAAWGDVDNDGHLDLVLGCLLGPNRYFRNKGDGTFEGAGEKLGLHTRVFNTQAVCLADVNGDGVLDMVFNNEGQDAVVLLGAAEMVAGRAPVTLRLAGSLGVTASRIRVLGEKDKVVASWHASGGDGRGGQAPLLARFALAPGTYQVEHSLSNGQKRSHKLVVGESPVRLVFSDKFMRKE